MATASPSISAAPTAEVVETQFCGVDYNGAMSNCTAATACPKGAGCPTGMSCFAGISCAALLPPPTLPPTTFWGKLVGEGSTAPPVPRILRYCGMNPEDATNSCASNMPCHDGNSLVCPSGETCFDIEGQCGIGTVQPSAPASSYPKAPAPFDPNNTFYCGENFEDAVLNCYNRTACPDGVQSECPTGQTCYPIVVCETPPPVPATIDAGSGGLPTSAPTPPPLFDLGSFTKTDNTDSGSHTMTLKLAKSIAIGGATLIFIIV